MRNIFFTLLALLSATSTGIAQNDTMYLMKNGAVMYKQSVLPADVDSVIFYKPANAGSIATVTDYDGNVYSTVTIGTQVWMAENLKTTKYADGTAIPLVNTTSTWEVLTETSKAYCWYNNDVDNKATYGALYTWAAAMNGALASNINPSGVQGICPSGWHLPSDAEWQQLTEYLGGYKVAGGKLKETGTTHWLTPNTDATNETGYAALPGGSIWSTGFFAIGETGYWWTTREYNDLLDCAWARRMMCNFSSVATGAYGKESGYSVRCLKD